MLNYGVPLLSFILHHSQFIIHNLSLTLHTLTFKDYVPATVRPSTSSVGDAIGLRNSRSEPTMLM